MHLRLQAHLILPQLDEGNCNVAQHAHACAAIRWGHLVQRHAVHLDGCRELALLKVDVAHVDAQAPCLQAA